MERYKCGECDGKGKLSPYNPKISPYGIICSRCRGTGWVDWVENILNGKKKMK